MTRGHDVVQFPDFQIAAELQAQYLLNYYAPDERADGVFRRITVRVPKRPDLRVRARQGYYAPKA
jgi:hypothetical protein